MEVTIAKRFDDLLEEGKRLASTLPRTKMGGVEYLVGSNQTPQYQAWITSSINLIKSVTVPSSDYHQEIERILQHENWKFGVPTPAYQQVFGLLMSTKQEFEKGLLRQIEYVIAAETFDDFLDHASSYHKGNMKIESGVLASAVLEDTIKKIAKKNGINPSGKAIEELIDELAKANVITLVKAKRYKGFSGVRNSALHAEWDEIDIKDVGELLSGIREMIEQYL